MRVFWGYNALRLRWGWNKGQDDGVSFTVSLMPLRRWLLLVDERICFSNEVVYFENQYNDVKHVCVHLDALNILVLTISCGIKDTKIMRGFYFVFSPKLVRKWIIGACLG